LIKDGMNNRFLLSVGMTAVSALVGVLDGGNRHSERREESVMKCTTLFLWSSAFRTKRGINNIIFFI